MPILKPFLLTSSFTHPPVFSLPPGDFVHYIRLSGYVLWRVERFGIILVNLSLDLQNLLFLQLNLVLELFLLLEHPFQLILAGNLGHCHRGGCAVDLLWRRWVGN